MVEVPSSNLGSPTKQKGLRTAGAFWFGRSVLSENFPFHLLVDIQSGRADGDFTQVH